MRRANKAPSIIWSGLVLLICLLMFTKANPTAPPQEPAAPVHAPIDAAPSASPTEPNGAPTPVSAVPHAIEAPGAPSACTPCLPGNFSGPECDGCPSGSCLSTAQCLPCPAGQHAQDPGMSKCKICEAGRYAPVQGLDRCKPCLPGYYCPQETRGTTSMSLCPPGTRCPSIAMAIPLPCSAGYYCRSSGMTSQMPCPEGYYCPNVRTVNPILCPPNHMCLSASTTPKECPSLYKSSAGAVKCVPAPTFFILIIGVLALVIGVGIGIYIFRVRWMADHEHQISTKRTKPTSDRTRLITSNEDTGYNGT